MAKYDLSKQLRKQQFIKRVKSLLDKNKMVELKDLTKRSVDFNAYLHLCLSAYAIYTGYTLNYVKQHIFKVLVSPSIFIVEVANTETGEIYEEVRSSASLSNEELASAMFNFKEHCGEIDFRLPERDDLMYQREIEEAAEQQKLYLNKKL